MQTTYFNQQQGYFYLTFPTNAMLTIFMAQQKQDKQLILAYKKNIFTYRFQPMQCLQPNFMTDGIRYLPQLQHMQPNFVN